MIQKYVSFYQEIKTNNNSLKPIKSKIYIGLLSPKSKSTCQIWSKYDPRKVIGSNIVPLEPNWQEKKRKIKEKSHFKPSNYQWISNRKDYKSITRFQCHFKNSVGLKNKNKKAHWVCYFDTKPLLTQYRLTHLTENSSHPITMWHVSLK